MANRGGAPKGNSNAFKHGLYAKLYTPEQKADLKKMALDDLAHEINAARVVASDILKCHYEIMATGKLDIDQLAKLDNSFCNAIAAISTCVVKYSFLNGDNTVFNDALEEALAGLPFFKTRKPNDQIERPGRTD